jgi:ADP-ribose pyrophosphatase YjhB (NUDIX family)
MEFIKDHIVVDPALQARIIALVLARKFGDAPDAVAHDLGFLEMPDGGLLRCFARHAADPILLDEVGQVVLITRMHEPGVGKFALPGGFMDAVDGVAEDGRTAALREAVEETGVSAALLAQCEVFAVGKRRYDRPFDIRRAWNDIAGTAIKKGELFTVSTQGFCVRIPGDLRDVALAAGDDAASVRVMRVDELPAEIFAVPDHLAMILEAVGLIGRGFPLSRE